MERSSQNPSSRAHFCLNPAHFCLNPLQRAPFDTFKSWIGLIIMPRHHATSPCHVIMPRHQCSPRSCRGPAPSHVCRKNAGRLQSRELPDFVCVFFCLGHQSFYDVSHSFTCPVCEVSGIIDRILSPYRLISYTRTALYNRSRG